MKLTCFYPTRETLTLRLWVVGAEHATEATSVEGHCEGVPIILRKRYWRYNFKTLSISEKFYTSRRNSWFLLCHLLTVVDGDAFILYICLYIPYSKSGTCLKSLIPYNMPGITRILFEKHKLLTGCYHNLQRTPIKNK